MGECCSNKDVEQAHQRLASFRMQSAALQLHRARCTRWVWSVGRWKFVGGEQVWRCEARQDETREEVLAERSSSVILQHGYDMLSTAQELVLCMLPVISQCIRWGPLAR